MKKNILPFSVLMSVYYYDNPLFFDQALSSVFNQTVLPDELVLVVDGPIPERTKDVIHRFRESYNLIIIWLDVNVGHGNAKRVGLERCHYNLVAIMDSDDICDAYRFEKQLYCFSSNDKLSVVGGAISEFLTDIDISVGKRILPSTHDDIVSFLKLRCPMNHMTVMFKKSDVQMAGGYLDWHHNEDYYLWIRMYEKGCVFMNLEDILVYARVGLEFYKRRGGWKYFISEKKIQQYMLSQKIISKFRFVKNIIVRFLVQVMITDNLRQFIFKKYFRSK